MQLARALSVLAFTFTSAMTCAADARWSGPEGGSDHYASLYAAVGRMRLPSDYREWIFLSSGLDMLYIGETATPPGSSFDNVFVDPFAYGVYRARGMWPEHTVLIKEDRGGAQQGSINQRGHFQTQKIVGIEAHVKDSKRFPGGWGFFFWKTLDSGPAKLIPHSADCYSCHEQHASVETTFVQFYPTLLGAGAAR